MLASGVYFSRELGTTGDIKAQEDNMGWLFRLAGFTQHLRLDVLMQFDIESGQGVASLRWTALHTHPSLLDEQCRIALVALLYARTLVNHNETRVELFHRMARAAKGVLEGDGKLIFEPWHLHGFGRDFAIWPWTLADPGTIGRGKTYSAVLQATSRGVLDIHLKMAVGLERVLAPSVALIAASGLAKELNNSDRATLARVLLGINAHYESPGRIRLLSEPDALAAAMAALPASGVSRQSEATSRPTVPHRTISAPGSAAGEVTRLRSLEAALEQHLSTRSVQDLRDFPCPTYSDFLAQHKAGSVELLTSYDSTAFDAVASRHERVMHYLLTWSPFLISLALGALSIAKSNYWLLLGIPTAILGFLSSSPLVMKRGGYALLLWAVVFTILAWVKGAHTAAFIIGSYALSNSFTDAARLQCDTLMRVAVAESELVLVWLHLRGTVIVVRKAK